MCNYVFSCKVSQQSSCLCYPLTSYNPQHMLILPANNSVEFATVFFWKSFALFKFGVNYVPANFRDSLAGMSSEFHNLSSLCLGS